MLSTLTGDKWLMIAIMYGCGLTGFECLHLRIKNIDFKLHSIHIENGNYTRKTLLPFSLKNPLQLQIEKIKLVYQENIYLENYAGVIIPNSPQFEKPQTSRLLQEHFLFPSKNIRINKKTGLCIQYPKSESYLNKTIKVLTQKTSTKQNVSCSCFRHSFATHLIEEGCDIHLVQKLLGHKNLQSTMIYKELANQKLNKIISPLDNLLATI